MKHFSDALFDDCYQETKNANLTEAKQDLSSWNEDMGRCIVELANLIKLNKDGTKVKLIKEKLNELVKTYKHLAKPGSAQDKNLSIAEEDPTAYNYGGREGTGKCSECGKEFDLKKLYSKIREGSGKWVCPDCGGYLEIPTKLEIFSSKFGQCQDCFDIYIMENKDTCDCGSELKYLNRYGKGSKIPPVEELTSTECPSCGKNYKLKDILKNAKNNGGLIACPGCKDDTIKLPDSYKSRVKECKYCGGTVLKTVKECPQCKSDEFQDYK